MRFYWYSILWWFDMPMHFLGGVWVGLAGIWALLYSGLFSSTSSDKQLVLRTMIIVFAIGFLWEVFEYTVQHLIPGANLADPIDSVSDIFFDLSGGAFALLYFFSSRPRWCIIKSWKRN